MARRKPLHLGLGRLRDNLDADGERPVRLMAADADVDSVMMTFTPTAPGNGHGGFRVAYATATANPARLARRLLRLVRRLAADPARLAEIAGAVGGE